MHVTSNTHTLNTCLALVRDFKKIKAHKKPPEGGLKNVADYKNKFKDSQSFSVDLCAS